MTVPFLLHQIQISSWVQVGAFFLVIHSLVSTLGYRYILTQPYFFSNSKTDSKLLIPFHDSIKISLCFLKFIYLVGATFDINTTVSTCGVTGNISTTEHLTSLYPNSPNFIRSVIKVFGLQDT